MKQLLLRRGSVLVEDVPPPAKNPHHVLVEVKKSLISTGTELATVHLSQTSLLEKIKDRPQEIQKVLESVRVRGISKTFSMIQGKLDESRPLGYSCSGVVIGVGEKVTSFQIGDRVACAGASLANHAEIVSVPTNLVVKVPSNLNDQSASFVTLGAIALQGVRRADVKLGEIVCVIGLGLIGQLTVQLLVAAGCKVVGLDLDASRVEQAIQFGMIAGATSFADLNKKVLFLTGDRGVDSCLITASTSSDDPANQAFEITRKKGKVVVVGLVGMNLKRSPFYEKEQDFLISCSYGPGRYDASYEQEGQDYPYAFVRWTENRNMESFLDLLAQGKVKVDSLIQKEVPLGEASKAYESLQSKSDAKPLAVVLSYEGGQTEAKIKSPITRQSISIKSDKVRLGLIGAGNFTRATHLPNLESLSSQVKIEAVCTSNSATAENISRKVNAALSTTSYQDILKAPNIDAVLIATPHNHHAQFAKEAIQSGKHVFLEKPVSLTQKDLDELNDVIQSVNPLPVLAVGFNRRFSPMILKTKSQTEKRNSPLMMVYRVNAGMLPLNHWTKSESGGGRLIGEACHMIDVFQFLTASPLKSYSIRSLRAKNSEHVRPDENFAAQFEFEDGSLGELIYTATGSSSVSKEFIEIHWDGNSISIDDFKSMTVNGKIEQSAQDKGHAALLQKFFQAIQNKSGFPISWEDLYSNSKATLDLQAEVWGHIK